jgi:nicotine blue oxidoreductase
VAAIVLAGGAGVRMGGPKALLRAGGESFLARVCGLLARAGADDVIAVVGHEAARVAREAGAPPSAILVVNDRAAEGMLTSVWRGLDEAERLDADAVLLHPVDHPLVEVATVERVLDALRQGAVVAVPSHDGRRGHPGGFARAAWPALRAASPGSPDSPAGARGVLHAHPEWIVHVPGDAGCRAGIDTPEDYARLIGSPP